MKSLILPLYTVYLNYYNDIFVYLCFDIQIISFLLIIQIYSSSLSGSPVSTRADRVSILISIDAIVVENLFDVTPG